MSCAHSFGEWCSECIDGMVQDYNRVRAELRAAQEALKVLKAIRGWDMLDGTADGPYWKRVIDAALTTSPAAHRPLTMPEDRTALIERAIAADEGTQVGRDEVVALLRRIVVRDGLNDNQWFWLHDCKELLARIDAEAARTASPADPITGNDPSWDDTHCPACGNDEEGCFCAHNPACRYAGEVWDMGDAGRWGCSCVELKDKGATTQEKQK